MNWTLPISGPPRLALERVDAGAGLVELVAHRGVLEQQVGGDGLEDLDLLW
jgi:hypothetical protein